MNDQSAVPAVVTARNQALRRLALEAKMHEANARIMEARASDDNDPGVTVANADQHRVVADDAHSRLALVAEAAGKTVEAIHVETADERRAIVETHLSEWRELRAVHQDFIDHPELYGGVDLSGRPLVEAEQRNHIKAYDAAIAEAEAELDR